MAILNWPTDGRLHRLYDAAALRHVAALLEEIEVACKAQLELSVRVLARTHVEAFLYALYLHFGGYEAVPRVAQDTLEALKSTQNDFVTFNDWLKKEKKRLTKLRDKIRKDNAANSAWNTAHADQSPRPVIDEPHVPRLSTTSVDLTGAIAEFGNIQARPLSVREVVDALTKWAPDKGFARESFVPMYDIYRVMSGGASAPDSQCVRRLLHPGGWLRSHVGFDDRTIADPVNSDHRALQHRVPCGLGSRRRGHPYASSDLSHRPT